MNIRCLVIGCWVVALLVCPCASFAGDCNNNGIEDAEEALPLMQFSMVAPERVVGPPNSVARFEILLQLTDCNVGPTAAGIIGYTALLVAEGCELRGGSVAGTDFDALSDSLLFLEDFARFRPDACGADYFMSALALTEEPETIDVAGEPYSLARIVVEAPTGELGEERTCTIRLPDARCGPQHLEEGGKGEETEPSGFTYDQLVIEPVLVDLVITVVAEEPDSLPFHRGDPNDDGAMNLTDGVAIFRFLFAGAATPTCLEAADADNSSRIELTDGIFILNYLFRSPAPPPALPGPPTEPCGFDPDPPGSPGDLTCLAYTSC